jgi:hypothetical protein
MFGTQPSTSKAFQFTVFTHKDFGATAGNHTDAILSAFLNLFSAL